MAQTDDPRRQLPGVDTLLAHPALSGLADTVSPVLLTGVVRGVLSEARRRITGSGPAPTPDSLASSVLAKVRELEQPSPRRVINATGVILHTGLGRAPMGEWAIDAVRKSAGYCDLEFDLPSGERGDRQEHVEELLCTITGAEAALVVNNNAAALYLVLNALGYHREVIVSRGQLIEIGGSFRLPDIMVRSGVRLVEVGATNRTRVEDYRDAITARTALLLSAHPSNYRIMGFTESVAIEDLCALGKEQGVPVVDDIGNGLLWDWTSMGLPPEPNVAASLKAGSDLALVSGDKALGGPQSGIILGKRDLVRRVKKSPLARVVRAEKMTLSALNSTLRAYLNRATVPSRIPFWAMLSATPEQLRERAQHVLPQLQSLAAWKVLEVRDTASEAGSGTLPAVSLPSVGIAMLPEGMTAAAWAKMLRLASVPVVATVRQDLLWLNMRTISPSDEAMLVTMITEALRGR
ncbi:MAG TPA: L-seryl-tRNA(Sec) selenium transferase [bacterium]